jgi:hypothetical protein
MLQFIDHLGTETRNGIEDLIFDYLPKYNIENYSHDIEIVKWFMSKKCYNMQNDIRLFERACARGHLDTICLCLTRGIAADVNDNVGLELACKGGHLETVKYLIDLGCEIKHNNYGALTNAINSGHKHIVEFLQEKWSGITYSISPGDYLLATGNLDMLLFLTKKNILAKDSNFVLIDVIRNNHYEFFIELVNIITKTPQFYKKLIDYIFTALQYNKIPFINYIVQNFDIDIMKLLTQFLEYRRYKDLPESIIKQACEKLKFDDLVKMVNRLYNRISKKSMETFCIHLPDIAKESVNLEILKYAICIYDYTMFNRMIKLGIRGGLKRAIGGCTDAAKRKELQESLEHLIAKKEKKSRTAKTQESKLRVTDDQIEILSNRRKIAIVGDEDI